MPEIGPPNLWSDDVAAQLSPLDLLVYRSNLLGQDRSVCNWKGGNTSSKLLERDHLGREIEVLWVKGSGTDLKTIDRRGFAALKLHEVLPLLEREAMSDEEMVAYLRRCLFLPDGPRPSIETLLHAFIPAPHVDHTHPDAVVALCNAEGGESLAREAFGDEVIWIPYQRPGFALAKQVALALRARPQAKAVFLAHHGLVTWGETQKECYHRTIEVIRKTAEFIAQRRAGRPRFGGARLRGLPPAERQRLASELMPVLRGLVSQRRRMILHFDDSEPVLELVNSANGRELALTGSACPDHLVHTKPLPLWLEADATALPAPDLVARLKPAVEAYREAYQQYLAENRRPDDPEGDPYPRIVLIPGLGLISTGPDKDGAENSAGLYHRAIEAMAGAEALGRYTSLSPRESYDVEYWPLELYKLTLAPPEQEFARRVAFITGGASGIGRATALRFAARSGHVVIADINEEGARRTAAEIAAQCGHGRALAVHCDVTDEAAVAEAFRQAVITYGGVDVVVNNAGIAAAAPVEETDLATWRRIHEVLVTGYFLVAREAFRVFKRQGLGGNLVFVTSKNALVASRGAAAYNAAKAAEAHLARSLAEEGGAHGIRVNCVAPDAVLEGSSIWNSRWREERARAYGIPPEELERYYRERTTLKANVYPEDVAEAILFLASDRSAKTTGCTITVDGGVVAAYTR